MNFTASKYEIQQVAQIAKRANKMAANLGVDYSVCDAMMDIAAAHSNGCPLKLDELIKTDDGTFGHDVFGIRRHINRTTGELQDCFLPRLAIA